MEWHEDPALWAELLPALLSEGALHSAVDEATAAAGLVGLPPGARILDLCCGPGRHSVELALQGYRVTGVDQSTLYLETARQRALQAEVDIEFVNESMLTFLREGTFDGVINLFSSFGYFSDRGQDQQVLANICASLKFGGRVVLDVMGKEVLARTYDERHWQQMDNGRFWLADRRVVPGWDHAANHWVFVGNGETKEYRFEHRIYSGSELADMLRKAGFSKVDLFGSLQGRPYDLTAERLIAVGSK